MVTQFKVGDIRRAKDIGRKGYHKYILHRCSACGMTRWVDEYTKTKFNLCHRCTMKKSSDEVSRTIKKLWQDPTYREHMRLVHKGHIHSVEHKQNISKGCKVFFANPENKEAKELARQASIRMWRNPAMHEYMSKLPVFRNRVGANNPMYGKHWSEEKTQQMSESMSGSGNPCWLGGIGQLPYSWQFNGKLKDFIRERDNYTCQLCGVPENGRKHSVHHYLYNKGHNPSELILLCLSCNSKVDFNREYWKEYFITKMVERHLCPA